MGVVDMMRGIKQIHPNKILLLKVGKFFQTYGKDAYIIAYLFDYQLKKVEINTNTTGFPEAALNKVMKTLEDKKINYMVLDKGDQYSPIEREDFKQDNQYINMYNKAHRYQVKKNKIDGIYEYLITNIDDDVVLKEQLQRIEEILYERR